MMKYVEDYSVSALIVKDLSRLGREYIGIFSGLVRCADCGAKLYYCTCKTYRDDSQDHFVCSNYKSNTGSCQIHCIREVTLYKPEPFAAA